jgi:hypothetical protein
MRIMVSLRNTYMRIIVSFFLCSTAVVLLSQSTPDKGRQRDKPADAAELAAIAERGRAIAAYDQVAWHATDAVQALKPKDGLVEMYIGRRTNDGWVVAFGKLNAAKDTFLLAFEVTPSADIKNPSVKVNDPAIEDRDQWLYIARAVDIARSNFNNQGRPYNDAVLPAPGGSWYVYFYPGATTSDIFPTGADTRFRVSGDGTKIEETHKMHVSRLEFKSDPAKKTEMTFHTAVLDDAPEDTDVANVLMMGGIPQMIATHNFMYRINADGTHVYLGTTKELLKKDKK